MYEMIKIQRFQNIMDNYETKNLSFMLFEDIDFSLDEQPKSFYRSDFRRSKIVDCIFFNNIFGRADFIDVYIENTDFNCVNWGSCLFKNSYITASRYNNNSYRGISLQFNTFNKCDFTNEKFVFNAYKCKFIKCKFFNCTFEKSSLEDLYFENCTFDNVNIAECHSENLKFDSCKMKNLKLGVTYWSTYLFKYTKIEDCIFMYQGNQIDIMDITYFQEYINMLLQQDRLYEFLNCIIINNTIYNNIIPAFKYVIKRLELLPDYIRKKNMEYILQMLLFYFNYNSIQFEEYNIILVILSNINWSSYSFEEIDSYLSKISRLNKLFDDFRFSPQYLETINIHTRCEIAIRLDFNNETQAMLYLDKIFNMLNSKICMLYDKPLYNKIKSESGSIILTISSYLLLGMLLSYVIKRISHNNESIKIERALSKSLQKKLSADNISFTEIKKINEIAKDNNLISYSLDEDAINNLSKELTKGEIISLFLKVLF